MDCKVYKGRYYFCTKTVIMDVSREEAYTRGKVYYAEDDNNLTDNQGDPNHGIDTNFAARYFVPVDAVVKAYAEGIRARFNNRKAD